MSSELKMVLDAVNGLKDELNVIKSELNEVKSELSGLKSEFYSFKSEVNQRFDRQDDMIHQLINNVAATNRKLDELKEEQKEAKQEIQQLKVAQLDSFRDMKDQLETIKAQQTDIEFAHAKINHNERDIARIKKVILG